MKQYRNYFDKFFRDESGKIILVQAANVPLLLWLVASLLGLGISSGVAARTLDVVAFGALFTWAWLEIFSGVNYFRRVLGLVVLVFIIINRVV